VRFAAKYRAPVKRGNNYWFVPGVFSLPYLKIITQQVQKLQNNSTVFYTPPSITADVFGS
jgi:hypothetical protein